MNNVVINMEPDALVTRVKLYLLACTSLAFTFYNSVQCYGSMTENSKYTAIVVENEMSLTSQVT